MARARVEQVPAPSPDQVADGWLGGGGRGEGEGAHHEVRASGPRVVGGCVRESGSLSSPPR